MPTKEESALYDPENLFPKNLRIAELLQSKGFGHWMVSTKSTDVHINIAERQFLFNPYERSGFLSNILQMIVDEAEPSKDLIDVLDANKNGHDGCVNLKFTKGKSVNEIICDGFLYKHDPDFYSNWRSEMIDRKRAEELKS